MFQPLRCSKGRRTNKQIRYIDSLHYLYDIKHVLETEQLTNDNCYIMDILSTTNKAIDFIEEGDRKKAIEWANDPSFWGTSIEQKIILALLHWAN